MTYVALLRGINVGGKNKLPMKDLAWMFAAAGCGDVKTYIASGNVVFKATAKLVERLPVLISKRIEERFGLEVPVVLRRDKEMEAVVGASPFAGPGADFDYLAVLFLADLPSHGAVSRLDAKRSPPDEFVVRGREIYLRCPNGFAKTKLTNDYFDRTLETTSTGRNWRTVLKLVELTKE